MATSLTGQEAARRLGVSPADINKLVQQEILHPVQQKDGTYLFDAEAIGRIASNNDTTLSEEAAQVGIQIQQEVVYSVSALRRLSRRLSIISGIGLALFIVSVILTTALFKLYPDKLSNFFGYYYQFNANQQTGYKESFGQAKVLGASTTESPDVSNADISIVASITKPIAATSLLLLKATDNKQYFQIVQKPTPVLQPGAAGPPGSPGSPGKAGASGANGQEGPAGLNGQVLTINGGVPDWMSSTGLTAEADTLASVTGRGASTDTALTLSSSANDFTLGTLRLNNEVITDLSGSGLTVASGTLNVAGLTNASLSGSAGITNTNLENSSVTINTTGPLGGGGSTSLGGFGLTLDCASCLTTASNIFNVSPTAGSDFTIASGNTLGLAAGLNITTVGDSSGTVTFSTTSVPTFTTVNGLTIVANGSNTLSVASGKVFGVNNSVSFSGIDGTTFSLPSSSGTLVGRSSSDTLLNKVITASNNTVTGLTNANLSGSASISNTNLANSGLSLAGNSGSGSVSLGGGLTFSGSGITAVTASGSTLTITTNEADTLASVTARGNNTSTNLTFSGGLIFSGSVTFSSLASCRTLATNASGVLGCGDTTGDGAAFTDISPATLVDNDTTELFNDASKPRITPTVSGQTILVSVHARFTGGGNTDTNAAVRIVRNIGSTANCSGSTQVGDSFSAFLTNSTDIVNASGTFLDSPSTTSQVYYTVCSSANSKLGSIPASNRIDVTLVRVGR